jgi:hypothetical protein
VQWIELRHQSKETPGATSTVKLQFVYSPQIRGSDPAPR